MYKLTAWRSKVRTRLEAKERALVGRAERDVEMLERDVDELKRRDEEIAQLMQVEDNAHFFQVRRYMCRTIVVAVENNISSS